MRASGVTQISFSRLRRAPVRPVQTSDPVRQEDAARDVFASALNILFPVPRSVVTSVLEFHARPTCFRRERFAPDARGQNHETLRDEIKTLWSPIADETRTENRLFLLSRARINTKTISYYSYNAHGRRFPLGSLLSASDINRHFNPAITITSNDVVYIFVTITVNFVFVFVAYTFKLQFIHKLSENIRKSIYIPITLSNKSIIKTFIIYVMSF